MPTEHYKSDEAYRKSRAYTHIHGIPTHAKFVHIEGKGTHRVVHSGKKKGRARKHKRKHPAR